MTDTSAGFLFSVDQLINLFLNPLYAGTTFKQNSSDNRKGYFKEPHVGIGQVHALHSYIMALCHADG